MCNYCYDFNKDSKNATSYTRQRNKAFADALGLQQEMCTNTEYELAKQNCIYPAQEMVIKAEDGRVVWSVAAFAFLAQDKAPDTVNPSLWMNGKCNAVAGVFEVVKDAIYQVRGFDIANLTIIRGKTGWIVQDVMSNIETSKAALQLLEQALNEKIKDRIRAVIISHSHADHYGGVRGVVSKEQVGNAKDGKIPIYVPAGFDEECVKENIFAGNAMARRAQYQFGADLVPGEKGLISTGLGLAMAKGEISYIAPTDYVECNKTVVIDGITVEFQLTPGTEAPSEMNNYYADYKALWLAENCCGTLHNLYPIRGAQLRDSSAWTDYILEAMVKYADKSEVVFQSHNWPHFNTKENPHAVREYLRNNAAIYKYTHDQTMLYANQGYTAKEIARKIKLPKGFEHNWYARPYYGSLPINARAVYTKYLGFYNGNPNDIDPLTEQEAANAFIEYAGGEEAALKQAIADFQAGDYRKAAYAAGNAVYVNPLNEEARMLCADAFEQLGYIAESSIWRNAYLQGALELRHKAAPKRVTIKQNPDMLQCMSVDLLIKYIGILFDTEQAKQENLSFILKVKDKDKTCRYVFQILNGVVLPYLDDQTQLEDYATLTKKQLYLLLNKSIKNADEVEETNCFAYLEKVQKYLVDMKDYTDFHLIEA